MNKLRLLSLIYAFACFSIMSTPANADPIQLNLTGSVTAASGSRTGDLNTAFFARTGDAML